MSHGGEKCGLGVCNAPSVCYARHYEHPGTTPPLVPGSCPGPGRWHARRSAWRTVWRRRRRSTGQKEKPAATAKAPEESAPPKDGPTEEPPLPSGAKRGRLSKNVWLESEGKRRRVIVGAVVCLREGQWGLE